MIYRDRIDIISQILESANEGITKTRILYKAFLSYAQMKEYLTLLTEKDLVCYDENIRLFRTTEKGRQFLYIYSRISDMIKEGQAQQQQQMWIQEGE